MKTREKQWKKIKEKSGEIYRNKVKSILEEINKKCWEAIKSNPNSEKNMKDLSNFILKILKNYCIHKKDVRKIKFSINQIGEKIKITPKNLFTALACWGMPVAYKDIENEKKYMIPGEGIFAFKNGQVGYQPLMPMKELKFLFNFKKIRGDENQNEME